LPVGLQLIGAVTDEPLLLHMAQCFEKELALQLRPPGF
jgi:Asp-tRNA(Asn)/Glu-tRNA(Gln) amidotransferase A subunit family amidase